ncbi:MAG: arginine decarboxylase [Chloroflexota bacterium]|nr:arginine decarboxylase [Chloroflexota bacterium]
MLELDHRRTPLVDGIRRYQELGLVPYSTPGHKLGAGIDEEFGALIGERALRADIPLGGGVDDTHFGEETLLAAEALGAAAWGAEHSFYLVNGSSVGNHAYLLATLRPGDKVIVARDMHKSLLVALILTGAVPVYITPKLHTNLDVGLGVTKEDVATALADHPDAKLITLVSPSYCGVPSDLAGIAHEAHRRGVPVHVDEAWGPHFAFHPALPPSAMASGIDGAVISTHKVLGTLTQAAVLLTRGGLANSARIATAVGMVQTTSPAATILASIDACRRQMMLRGQVLLERAIHFAEDARLRLRALPGIDVLGADGLGIATYDLTKLVIDVHGLGISGFDVEAALRNRFRIGVEMSDLAGVVCLITIGDSESSIDHLVRAFTTLSDERRVRQSGAAALRSSGEVIAPGTQSMSPRDAFFATSREIPFISSAGEVSAELVIPYPPGIPVLAPGDIISDVKIAFLCEGVARGMYISGPADPLLVTIQVVAKTIEPRWR